MTQRKREYRYNAKGEARQVASPADVVKAQYDGFVHKEKPKAKESAPKPNTTKA